MRIFFSTIILSIAISFCFTSNVNAGNFINETFDIVSSPTDGTLTASGAPVQQFKFTQDGYLESVIVAWNSPATTTLYLRDRTASITYAFTTENRSSQFIKYSTSTPVQVYASNDYEFNFANYNVRRLSPNTTYTNSSGWDLAGSRTAFPNGAFTAENYDIYLRATLQETTGITFTDTPSSTCDFQWWSLNVNLDQDTQDSISGSYIREVVNWGFFPGILSYYDSQIDIKNFSGNVTLLKSEQIASGNTVYAQASICSSPDPDDCDFSIGSNLVNQVAVSDVWEFQVGYPANQCPNGEMVYTHNGVTSTLATAELNFEWCEDVENVLTAGLCRVVTFLFAPPQSSINNFTELKDFIADKPPFGYIAIYTSAWDSIDTNTTTSWGSLEDDMDITGWATLSFWDYIRTPLGWIIWIMFGWYVFSRFKHFSLQG